MNVVGHFWIGTRQGAIEITGAADNAVQQTKSFELIAIAVDASCTHMYAPGVRRHIRKALELGVTVEEILAVLQLTSILGIHSMALGAPDPH
jgi:alkylhydroperoxidase/carboxymuconolactone decarboxylase family protein YurZ